mgnify:CR=1 FL=1
MNATKKMLLWLLSDELADEPTDEELGLIDFSEIDELEEEEVDAEWCAMLQELGG